MTSSKGAALLLIFSPDKKQICSHRGDTRDQNSVDSICVREREQIGDLVTAFVKVIVMVPSTKGLVSEPIPASILCLFSLSLS